jgi:hypothetical protein
LLSLRIDLAKKMAVGNFLRERGYKCGNLEDFLYRMILFENEDFNLSIRRTLHLVLLGLKSIGWTKEDEENSCLSYIIDDICSFFRYPEGTEKMMYYYTFHGTIYGDWAEVNYVCEKKEESAKWTQSGELEKYLNRYRNCLNLWNEVKLDKYQELFDNKFALIRNGKYRHHLITGERKDDNGISLRIWTDKIFTREKEYKFNFRSDEELKKFLVDNGMVFDSFISNDFFLDEKSYILNFREGFDSQDLLEGYDFNPFEEIPENELNFSE